MSSKNNTVIFPHIPKCGGTTIKSQLKNQASNVFLDYDRPPVHAGYGKKMCDRRNHEASFIDFSGCDLIFGHFPIERYTSEKNQYVALCRDSYDRCLSHVNFLMSAIRMELQSIQMRRKLKIRLKLAR